MNAYYLDARDSAVESLFDTAIYRFLELHAPPGGAELVAVHTEILSDRRRKCVRLWSAEAVSQFERYWQEFSRERSSCMPF